MAIEYMSFEEVLGELQIDEEELKKLVSQGELRGFRAGNSMKFKKDDVLNLKQGRETEPTIILTDSDQEMGIAESSDELILEDSTSDTVINIGDIMQPGAAKGPPGAKGGAPARKAPPQGSSASGSRASSGSNASISSASGSTASVSDASLSGSSVGGKSDQEIIFDTTEEQYTVSPHDSDPEAAIPTVEVPSVSEDMGSGLVETESDAQLVEVGSDESMETEAFELMAESGETEAGSPVAAVKGQKASKRAKPQGQSQRMRALELEQRKSHAGMTGVLLLSLVVLALQGGVLINDTAGVAPDWLEGWTGTFRGMIESFFTMFAGA